LALLKDTAEKLRPEEVNLLAVCVCELTDSVVQGVFVVKGTLIGKLGEHLGVLNWQGCLEAE
jgi:hypothetical protein